MIIIITGATHTGKTMLAQKLLEKLHYPYLSIDLKMGLIRSKNTSLTPYDDDKLSSYLWPIVAEMIKTAIENKQNMIIEGCYIPSNYASYFDDNYLSSIKLIALAFTKDYIINNYNLIIDNQSIIENRIIDDDITIDMLINDNQKIINDFKNNLYLIDKDYQTKIKELLAKIN